MSTFADQDFVDLGLPIRTERLILRAGGLDDVDTLHARRNEPGAKEFQSWAVPYPRHKVVALLEELVEMPGPTLGEWWMLMVDIPGDGGTADVTIGDIAVHLDESGSIAEIGYNVASVHWGRGYATEAALAVIGRLFDRHPGLIRVQAQMDPDNLASGMVAERCGLIYEGQTRLSFLPEDPDEEPSDNRIYGMLRADWEAWNNRTTGPPKEVRLVEITAENVRAVCDLATHRSQDHLVAPVAHSLAEAFVARNRGDGGRNPWCRAVEADGELAGFVMLAAPTEVSSEPYLWRMLIDRRHQRRGIGRRVLDLVVDQARRWGGTRLLVSWVPGPGSPEPFYRGHGFVATGPADDSGEVPGSLSL